MKKIACIVLPTYNEAENVIVLIPEIFKQAKKIDSHELHVLVVDDEEDVQWLFKQNFRRAIKAGRLAFHFVFSGEEALTYLQTSDTPTIVLVLSDINMPGMTGLELLHAIKQDFEGLPVHMITAYGNDETRQQALAEA